MGACNDGKTPLDDDEQEELRPQLHIRERSIDVLFEFYCFNK